MASFKLELKKNKTTSRKFIIRNGGGGILSVSLSCETKTKKKNWLKIPPGLCNFNITSGKRQDIEFEVDTHGLSSGFKDDGTIKITSNGGNGSIDVNLSIKKRPVPIPVIVILAMLAIAGIVFGLIAYNQDKTGNTLSLGSIDNKVKKGWLGVAFQDSDSNSLIKGVVVREVIDPSPAKEAGLKVNDVIIIYDGEYVQNTNHLRDLIAKTNVGRRVKFTIRRDRTEIILCASIGERQVLVVNHLMTGITKDEFNNVYKECATPPQKYTFLDTDRCATQWFYYQNATPGDAITWKWYAPGEHLYYEDKGTVDTVEGCWRSYLDISGRYASYNPGQWQVKVYRNEDFLFSETFTISKPPPALAQFSVVKHLMTGVSQDEFHGKYSGCVTPPQKDSFLETDLSATQWFYYQNATPGDAITWEWYAPGEHFYEDKGTVDTVEGCWRSHVDISGNYASSNTGQWQVKVYRNGEFLFSETFTIEHQSKSVDGLQKLLDEALSLYRDGNYKEAINKWEEVLNIEPDNLEAKFNIDIARKKIRQNP